jgi:hypothetical protein
MWSFFQHCWHLKDWAGGEGKHSAALPSFGATVSVTREIRDV